MLKKQGRARRTRRTARSDGRDHAKGDAMCEGGRHCESDAMTKEVQSMMRCSWRCDQHKKSC